MSAVNSEYSASVSGQNSEAKPVEVHPPKPAIPVVEEVPAKRCTVILSAGHYPESPGACDGEWCEHEEAVRWVKVLHGLLSPQYKVLEVPTGHLRDKVKWINHRPADMCLEVHFNACGGCNAHGSETLYMPSSDRGHVMATLVQNKLGEVFPPSRGAKEGWYRMDRPGVKDYPTDVEGDEQPDYFLRQTRWPAIIVEPEFIHHKEVIQEERLQGCQAIVAGIGEFLIEPHNHEEG